MLLACPEFETGRNTQYYLVKEEM